MATLPLCPCGTFGGVLAASLKGSETGGADVITPIYKTGERGSEVEHSDLSPTDRVSWSFI